MATAEPPKPTPAAKARSVALRVLGAVGLAVGGVFVLTRTGAVDPTKFREALAALGPAPLALGMATALGVTAFQALRWWFVTRPVLRIRYRDAYATLLVGSFLNTFLPARAGDLLRVQYLSVHAQVSRATLLGTELVDFWSDKCGWLPAFVVFLFAGEPPSWMYRALASMLAISGSLVVLFTRFRPWLVRSAAQGSGWKMRLFIGVAANSPARLAVAGFVLAALPWLWETLAITMVSRLTFVPLTIMQAFVVLTAFNVVTAVPVPGNVGLHEAASSFVLVSFGVPVENAVAFALLYHVSQLLPGVLGGAIALVRHRRRPAPSEASTAPVLAPVADPPS